MEIQFLGATKTVTGSKYLLKAEKKVLVDCGLFQGLKDLRLRNREPFPVAPESIDAVVLTHAHLDHSGYLPLLVKKGFSGKIYATPLTIKLCRILLLDSGYLQEEEANRANRLGYSKHKPALPLYTKVDAEAVMKYFVPIKFHQDFAVGNMHFRFNRAGHILGAATVTVKCDKTTISFSGDLGRSGAPCLLPPEDILYSDYLVIESTYGDRLHEEVDPIDSLEEIIKRTVKRGGTVVIPAFAVGRTQSILYYIYRLISAGRIPDIPVFLDSPMAQSVTDIMMYSADEHLLNPDECHKISNMVRYIETVDESKEIDTYVFPKIIISASGMATGGRVLHHIRAFGSDHKNTILFTGFQAPGTRSEALLAGKKEIKMFGRMVPIDAEVVSLDNVSAHADYAEMLDWLGKLKTKPRKIFITHGNAESAAALADKIKARFAWDCVVPDYLQSKTLVYSG